MVATIQLLHVSPETQRHLKDGKWQDVDHLQFFVAILHGYWGKNSCECIRACACFHLEEMRKEVNMCDGNSLHKYCLCAIGFCLFCEKTHVSFEVPGGKVYYVIGLMLYSELGFNQQSSTICFEHVPDKGDLPWIDRFDKCKTDDMFVKLLSTTNTIPVDMSNYYEREIEEQSSNYKYTYEDLSGALQALKYYIFNSDRPTSYDLYKVKEFDNNSSGMGRMKYSIPFRERTLKYIKMRVTPQCDNTPIIRRCRFVYQYWCCNGKCAGILYFTDSHYGWDLIPDNEVKRALLNKFSEKTLNNLNFYEKLHKLSKCELFNLQNSITTGFPFVKIGILTMRKNICHLEEMKI